jgi:UDP-N-acetylglucosamine 2-epimerase (non-hydrolysing)
MKKIMTIVGTRPELIKLSLIIKELDKFTNNIFVHTGQNYDYELNEIFFSDLKLRKPDYFLNTVGKTTAETIGNVISKSDEIMDKEKPDAILLYGDTNSCLSVISAKRRKIPVFHLEAGNRCFDQRVPEELNRKIVDHLSDINMTNSEHARRYLISEGIRPETIIKVGSPMMEIFKCYGDDIDKSQILKKLSLKSGNYFVVSAHREENIDSDRNFNNLIDSLNAISDEFNKQIIFSTHPRTMIKIKKLHSSKLSPDIKILKPLGFFDYIYLQKNSYCVISDSGTITEESSLLGFPAITIREAHERPEGMDVGTLIMTGLKKDDIIESIKIIISQHGDDKDSFEKIPDYNTGNVSKKVLRIIMSYTEYINQKVWFKGI